MFFYDVLQAMGDFSQFFLNTTTNATFPKYVEVLGTKALKNVIMTTTYAKAIPQ